MNMTDSGGYHQFRWRGELIPDIRAWASARGERMVPYRATRTVPDLRTGGLVTETYDGEMPESFWSGLGWTDGWRYAELLPQRQ